MAAHRKSPRYVWTPGIGPDASALARMTRAFPRPRAPMGEAWFMGERKMYDEALTTPVSELDAEYVRQMLTEILSGPPCFGQMEEWTEWFLYILPHLIPQAMQSHGFSITQEYLVCAMFSQYPEPSFIAPYAGFRENMLDTLGQSLMSPDLWVGGKMRPGSVLLLESSRYGVPWWYRDEASGPVSASLFLCVKYLRPEQIGVWLESVLKIDCPFWRGQLMVWLLGARPFLEGSVNQPAQFDDLLPRITWEWSHVLKGNYSGDFSPELVLPPRFDDPISQSSSRITPFVSDENRAAFNEACRRVLTRGTREAWCLHVLSIPLLEKEMGDSIDQFAAIKF